MPEEQAAVAEPQAAEPQRDLRPDEPREFGTPISEIFKELMPYEHELEGQKAAEEGEKSTGGDKVAAPPAKEPTAPLQDAGRAIPEVPELPKELFGDTKVEKPAETPEVEPAQAETPKEFKGKTKEHFENLSKKEFETAKANRQLQKELKEWKNKAESGDPDSKTRIQQLESELGQYKQRIYAADVTLDPKFEAQFTIPRQQLLDRAKQAYQDAGGDPRDIEVALTATGKTRADKLEEVYNTVQSKYLLNKIERSVENVENIDAQIQGVMQNREAWLKQSRQMSQVERSKFYEQHEAKVKSALAEAGKYLEEQGWEVFKQTSDPNAKWWNEQLERVNNAAEHVMLKVDDPVQMAVGAKMMASAPIYRAMALHQKQRADKLEGLLKEYKGSEPGLGGESETKPAPSAVKDDDDMATAIIKRLRGSR